MQRRRVFQLIAGAAISGGGASFASLAGNSEPCSQDHEAWVEKVLERMLTIKPGMTKRDLLTVFTPDGGLMVQPRFVSRDCAYFKVDVEFKSSGDPNQDRDGFAFWSKDPDAIILKISQPYVEFSMAD